MLAPELGDRLDRYRLEAQLGQGALGAVYRAHDLRFERPVAVRVLDARLAASDAGLEHFLREARIAVRVRSPALARVLDFGQAGAHVYLVTEYLAGARWEQALDELRAAGRWLGLAEALHVARPLCWGVAHLHQRGLLHLAVHTGNLQWRSETAQQQAEDAVLADSGLGVWRAADLALEASVCRTPEQAAGQAQDARSDVFALGLVLYELVAGSRPFQPEPGLAAATRRFAEALPSPRAIRPELPEPVERVIVRALALDPAQRYPDAPALARALSELLPAGVRPGQLLSRAVPRRRPGAAAAASEDPASDDSALTPPVPATAPVSLHLVTPQLAVVPGHSAEAVLVIGNPGPANDEYQIHSDGLPSAWSSSPPGPIRVAAGGQQVVRLKFHPPRASASRAGRHLVRLRVVPARAAHAAAEARLTLSVGAYSDFVAELRPVQLQPRQDGRVVIANQGNTPTMFSLAWSAPDDALRFQPDAARLKVEPGENAAVEFQVAPRRSRWLGGEQSQAYRVQVGTPDGQRRTLTGRALVRARLPAWLFGAVTSAVALALGIVLLMVFLVQQGASALRLTTSARTEVAAQPPLFALTRTAHWLVADLDFDGLSNAQELAAGTYLEDADTDGDGRSDGVERLELRTDPLNPDTDGDGLRDGPDPDPGRAPPATATATATATTTAAPTPTVALTPSPTAGLDLNATAAAVFQTEAAASAETPPAQIPAQAATAPASPTFTAGPAPAQTVAALSAEATRKATALALAATSPAQARPPTVALSFAPAVVADTASAQLVITLTNPYTDALHGLSYTRDLAPLIIAGVPPASQCGGEVRVNATRLTLSKGALPPQATCAIVVAVNAPGSGAFALTFPPGSVTTANGGASANAASAQLHVLARPVVEIAFMPDVVTAGLTATLIITLTNPGPADLTGVAFRQDVEPFRLAPSGDAQLTCPSGDLAAAPLQSTLELSRGVIPAGGSCSVRVAVTAAQAGRLVFGPGVITSSGGPNTNSETANLSVK